MRKYLGGGFVYGVPARDLEEFEWLALTPEQQKAARNLYKKIGKRRTSPMASTKINPKPSVAADAVGVADTTHTG